MAVRAVGEHGEDLGTWDFTDAAGPESFRRELVVLFARHGRARWTSKETYRTRARILRRFLRDAAAAEPPITAVHQVSVTWWKQWSQVSQGRRDFGPVLKDSVQLPEQTRAYLETWRRRPVADRQAAKPKRAHSKAELKAVRDAAAATVRAARLRIQDNVALMERWRAGELAEGSRDWLVGQLLDHVARTGDVPRGKSGRRLSPTTRYQVGDDAVGLSLNGLFPTFLEAGAAAVLLIIHEGWNLSVLKKMQVPAYWPNADGDSEAPAVHRVATDKARRGKRRRHASNNLVDAGEGSSGWAMNQVLDLTRQARLTLQELDRPSSLLFLARRNRGGPENLDGFLKGSALEEAIWDWARSRRAAGVQLPPRISAQPLRHSAQVHHGRARNNTEATHAKDYLFKDEKVREDSRAVVESGLAKAVEHARERVEMRLVAHATGDTDYDADQVAKAVGVDRETAMEIVAGRLKTPVASCTDFENSDFSEAGKPCGVSFLLCFACRNAVATARDLPRVAYLHQVIEGLRATVTPAAWAADWEGHHARISDFLSTHTSPEMRAGLLSALAETDRHLIDRMLDRRLDP
ncbi:hypothetical protein [Streptomyces sp. BPTC-684]|uniref:hypothetical protein n=1 Tax=Streptomyces sp. BPTC-684 TaxID=3043734 RepID=UPI0024B2149A|nr:hypothetical protein [Streptomyces sp. BPTC-684]WHM36281.1 hypothetical protein QIY60_04615 [Streptomyces sp. BPTC-684]